MLKSKTATSARFVVRTTPVEPNDSTGQADSKRLMCQTTGISGHPLRNPEISRLTKITQKPDLQRVPDATAPSAPATFQRGSAGCEIGIAASSSFSRKHPFPTRSRHFTPNRPSNGISKFPPSRFLHLYPEWAVGLNSHDFPASSSATEAPFPSTVKKSAKTAIEQLLETAHLHFFQVTPMRPYLASRRAGEMNLPRGQPVRASPVGECLLTQTLDSQSVTGRLPLRGVRFDPAPEVGEAGFDGLLHFG